MPFLTSSLAHSTSVYASQRVPENEGDMNSRINSIFIAVLFLCVNAQVSTQSWNYAYLFSLTEPTHLVAISEHGLESI